MWGISNFFRSDGGKRYKTMADSKPKLVIVYGTGTDNTRAVAEGIEIGARVFTPPSVSDIWNLAVPSTK
ncbi:MAG: hypothetical protein DRI69_10915 [Bacteroidetes bacterium]|nr:MAG: hypothetical protein DRI69_10915 [Bacteroidota bacterium]